MRIQLLKWLQLFFQILISIHGISGQCLDDQKALLLDFKNTLTYNSSLSMKLVHWNKSTDCCDWKGVICTTTSGHVTGLDLHDEGISNGISSSSTLFSLKFLQMLDLSYNDFSSTQIPLGLFNLTALTYLNLGSCNLAGQISKYLANLTRLVHLDLSYNDFNDYIPSFQNSKRLTELDISNNNFSGTIPCTHFEGLVNLSSVAFGGNAFEGSIPSSLFSLPLLEGIYISDNSFEGSIPSSLFSLPSLKYIDLSNNHFNGLLPNFSNSASLVYVYLSNNNLNGSIPSSLFDLKSLDTLSLSSNKLSGHIQLESFHRLVELTHIDLSFNNLSIGTSRLKNSSTSLLPQVRELKLVSCKLQHFPNLQSNSELLYLDLSDNQIKGEIPNWIWNIGNGSLRELNLSHNLLVSLEKPYAIPRSLEILDLHSNHLTGDIPIPKLDMMHHVLERGPVGGVRLVDYSDNCFSSSIPHDIGNNLVFAYSFSVSGNNLTGNIPESLCNTLLLVLDLSNNSFSGIIPTCLLGGRKQLAVLSLGNNNLTGIIPDAFEGSCGLRTLDLYANNLDGKIPKSIANCTMLEVLNLGNNKMNDTFPCFLKSSPALRVLVLRHNMFHGEILCPGQRSNWTNLQIMDIASNYFTGKVPQNWFLNWTWMMAAKNDRQSNFNELSYDVYAGQKYHDTVTVTIKGTEVKLVKILTIFNSIDFSNNMFEGAIPDTIGGLKFLYLLNFSHNALTLSIPASLGNLKHLEALDLSDNKLSGKIPIELTSLTFLSVLNLSDNRLTGKIPIGPQFQTFTGASFQGNKELCGAQVNITCREDQAEPSDDQQQGSHDEIQWDKIAVEVGFAVGLGIVVLPPVFFTRWRKCYYELIDKVLLRVFKFQARGRRRKRGGIAWRRQM